MVAIREYHLMLMNVWFVIKVSNSHSHHRSPYTFTFMYAFAVQYSDTGK
jgi:hypothetical protein